MTDPRSDLATGLRLALNDEVLAQMHHAGTAALQYTPAEIQTGAAVSGEEWEARSNNAVRDVLVAALVSAWEQQISLVLEEHEAAICPEDVGCAEYIRRLKRDLDYYKPVAEGLEAGVKRAVPEIVALRKEAQRLTEEREQIRAKVREIRDEMIVAAAVGTPSREQWREWGMELEAVLATLNPSKEET